MPSSRSVVLGDVRVIVPASYRSHTPYILHGLQGNGTSIGTFRTEYPAQACMACYLSCWVCILVHLVHFGPRSLALSLAPLTPGSDTRDGLPFRGSSSPREWRPPPPRL